MSYQGAHSGAEVDDAVGAGKGTGNGVMVKSGTGTGVRRTITGSSRVDVTNGDGVSGNPTLDLTQVVIDSLADADTAFSWGNHANAGYLLSSSYTAADVKTKYESNADTNAFTDSEKSLVASAIQPGDPLALPHVVVSASKSLALTDANKEMQVDAAATLTIEADATTSFPRGTKISVLSMTADTVTITAAAGVTLNGMTAGSTTISAQFDGAVITKGPADAWVVTGGVEAVA